MDLFSKNKELKDPAIIVGNCLTSVVNRIMDSLEGEEYHWNKSWGVKRFESILLAKFIMDYSFNALAEDKLKDDEKSGYFKISNSAFSRKFNDEFSEVGIHFEDMQEDIENKIEGYFTARRENRPPVCWHNIYAQVTRSKSREELQADMQKQSDGLELIRGNENFANMVPQYESRLKALSEKADSFESAEMMLPHMVRFTKEKLKAVNLKKIKQMSKKLSKKDKGKDKGKDKKK